MKKPWGWESSDVQECLMRSEIALNYAAFSLNKLENGNYMVLGNVWDGLSRWEFDDLNEAYQQYRDWVIEEQLRLIERLT